MDSDNLNSPPLWDPRYISQYKIASGANWSAVAGGGCNPKQPDCEMWYDVHMLSDRWFDHPLCCEHTEDHLELEMQYTYTDAP